jgi:hypothetical protein
MLTEVEPNSKPPDPRRRITRYSWIIIAIAAIYVAFVLFSRWQANRDYEARAKAQAKAQQRSEDAQSIENMGGTAFAILGFYASPGLIHRGDAVSLCYSVANTQTLKIEPDINRQLWPSASRCVDIYPKKTTTYILTAQDAKGHSKTASLTIEVH